MSKGKHARTGTRHRRLTIVAIVAVVAVIAAGGTAYAAVRYDQGNAQEIMPGVSVAGVDVGGLSRGEAIKAVKREAKQSLQGELTIRAGDQTWTVTAQELGLSANVQGAVDRAMKTNGTMGLFSRVYHRIANDPVDRSVDLGFSSSKQRIQRFVEDATAEVTQEPTDAAVTVDANGDVSFQRSEPGRTLDTAAAVTMVRRALMDRQGAVDLPVEKVAPEVGQEDLGYTLVVSKARNQLAVYKGFDVVKTYGVATGTQEFPTPSGAFEVINKVANPTWVNPSPNGWGASLPASIPPGPGNPLGTRALYLNAPGIRIHGTYSEDSIGTAASHGCIRMRIAESEELYEIIPVGTPVYVY